MNPFPQFWNDLRARAPEEAAAFEARLPWIIAQFESPRLPEPGETAAISLLSPKTAALLFDRIWAGNSNAVPESIGFHGSSPFEFQSAILSAAILGDPNAFTNPVDRTAILSSLNELMGAAMKAAGPAGPAAGFERVTADGIRLANGIQVVTVYRGAAQRDAAYLAGDYGTIVASLRNLPIVDEAKLTWDQVTEFRADAEVRRKYRRFVHWLDGEMLGKPISFIEQEMAQRLEDYDRALRKHGIDTVYGTLSATLDAKNLIASSVAVGASAHFGEAWWGLLASGLLLGGKCLLDLTKAWIDYRTELQGAGPEIAFVAEVRSKLQ